MDLMQTPVNNLESAALNPEAFESEEFKLELLDCGPAYKIQDTGTTCLSCVCAPSCLCGSASTPD